MHSISFVWDKSKATLNKRKHKISFDEAKTVFADQNARLIFDSEHSKGEDRFVLLGLSSSTRILTVIHCYHEEEEVIRIISARKATKNEQKQYRSFRYEKRI